MRGIRGVKKALLESLKSFLNEGGLLPHGAKLDAISSDGVFFLDGNKVRVDVTRMSDGYRSILSLTFELIRQMVRAYGHQAVFKNFQKGNFCIDLPGVILIDEIDAHLHPSWQASSEHHRTVWYEMIRQRSRHPEVDDWLNRAEEATTWI